MTENQLGLNWSKYCQKFISLLLMEFCIEMNCGLRWSCVDPIQVCVDTDVSICETIYNYVNRKKNRQSENGKLILARYILTVILWNTIFISCELNGENSLGRTPTHTRSQTAASNTETWTNGNEICTCPPFPLFCHSFDGVDTHCPVAMLLPSPTARRPVQLASGTFALPDGSVFKRPGHSYTNPFSFQSTNAPLLNNNSLGSSAPLHAHIYRRPTMESIKILAPSQDNYLLRMHSKYTIHLFW